MDPINQLLNGHEWGFGFQFVVDPLQPIQLLLV